jgi:hypothetical protein
MKLSILGSRSPSDVDSGELVGEGVTFLESVFYLFILECEFNVLYLLNTYLIQPIPFDFWFPCHYIFLCFCFVFVAVWSF